MADTAQQTEEAGAKGVENNERPDSTPGLYRAVVIDVIYDPALYDPNTWTAMTTEVAGNADILSMAPRNSCIVKILNGAKPGEDLPYLLCFPFFSPHLALPLKPGEQVWVFLENPTDKNKAWGYWMSRVHGPDYVDDVNFTHLDRAFQHITTAESPVQKGSEEDAPEKEPGFPNGDDSNNLTLGKHKWMFEEIFLGSHASQAVTYEAVPRFTKRPGDLVIMGSNNTLICLGEERATWTKDVHRDTLGEIADVRVSDAATIGIGNAGEDWSGSTAETAAKEGQFPEPIPIDAAKVYKTKTSLAPGDSPADVPAINERFFMGTIDIVAGRSRWLAPEVAEPEKTQPRLIKNSRNQWEVDKNPAAAGTAKYPEQNDDNVQNRLDNPTEGDPDFLNDASRIYVSMNTLPDFNFGIEYPDCPGPDDDANVGNPISKDDTPEVYLKEFKDGQGQAAIVMKSDEIRIIARQDMEAENPIQGSITLIKEGTADDEAGEGRGIITIRPDGVIMIDGPKVVIGSGAKPREAGSGNQFSVGVGATEPMLCGDLFIKACHDFAKNLASSVEASVGNLGAPVLMAPLRGHVETFKSDMDAARSTVAKLL